MAHIFISYHKNSSREYARKLADHLIASGFDVWIDDRIDYGANWERVIFEAIDDAGAVIVLMTPGAYESDWVQAERLYARQTNKSIYPLLLDGSIFPAYLGWQVADVRGGVLPPEEFLNDLAAAGVERHAGAGRNIAEKVTPQSSSRPHSPTPVVTNPVLTPEGETKTTPKTATQARRFEAAMPSQTRWLAPGTGQTEVWAKVSLPDSPGLRDELPAVIASGDVIGKDDTRSTRFPFKFPVDPETGEPTSVNVTVRPRSEALEFDSKEIEFELPPDSDSQTIIFNARVKHHVLPSSGRIRVILDLIYESRVVAQIGVSSEIVTAIFPNRVWVLAGAAVSGAPSGAATPPGEQTRGGAHFELDEAEEDIALPPKKIREPEFQGLPTPTPPVTAPTDDALSPVPQPGSPPEPQKAIIPPARVDRGAEEYDRYAPVSPAQRRAPSFAPIALVASLAVVAFVVLLLVQQNANVASNEQATATGFALSALTDVAVTDLSATQLSVQQATQTAARNLTQTAVTIARTPTATERASTGATAPVRVGVASTFVDCPTDTSAQLRRRIDADTEEINAARQTDFDDLSGLVGQFDVVIWGECSGARDTGITILHVDFLTSNAPPEVFDLEHITVSHNTGNYDYFSLVVNAAIRYSGGAYSDVISALGAVLDQTPHEEQHPQFQFLLANSYVFAGQPENALDLYERAAFDLNLLPLAYNNRAIAETELLLRDGKDNAPEGISVESALTHLETAHLNTSDGNQQAVILTNIGMTTMYFTQNYAAARSRCQDALNFNSGYEMAQVCLVAIAASEVGTSEQQCPLLESAQATVQASLLENTTATNRYAEADMLFWQAFLFGIWEVCEPGQDFGNIAESLRQRRAELLAAQPILLEPDRFE